MRPCIFKLGTPGDTEKYLSGVLTKEAIGFIIKNSPYGVALWSDGTFSLVKEEADWPYVKDRYEYTPEIDIEDIKEI